MPPARPPIIANILLILLGLAADHRIFLPLSASSHPVLRSVAFPDLTLPSGAGLWCARQAVDFARSFGFSPACELAGRQPAASPASWGADGRRFF